jgi:hypothetical protein
MDAQKAVKILEKEGYRCVVKNYSSKKPLAADCERVVRKREIEHRTVEITVCGFKTEIE